MTISSDNLSPAGIVRFWFSSEVQPLWFNSTEAFDKQLTETYLNLYHSAARGELADWENDATGALALAIVLDQFPLNMFRGKPEAFATEQDAVRVARQAIENRLDQQLEQSHKVFLYMPLMHSESMADQDLSVAMFEAAGLEDNLRFARHHRDIVERFGRFPHRNVILGRDNTEAEVAYLSSKEAFLG